MSRYEKKLGAIIAAFPLTRLKRTPSSTSTSTDPNRISYVIPTETGDVKYESEPYLNEDGGVIGFNLMPVIVNGQGAPWREANNYILERLTDAIKPNMTTYKRIADDLQAYLMFLETVNIKFTDSPQKKYARPTYRFFKYLQDSIDSGDIAVSTASKRMRQVIAFYRWARSCALVQPEYAMWKDHQASIRFEDSYGRPRTKGVITTDLRINVQRINDPDSEFIQDGGELRPLPVPEQLILFQALAELNNMEATLMHLIPYSCGARMQTFLTTRIGDIRNCSESSRGQFRLRAGRSFLVDSKNDKRMVLYLPKFVHERLSIYLRAPRTKLRYEKAGGDYDEQFLFVTNRGGPYYKPNSESRSYDPDYQKKYKQAGGPLAQFIRDRVIPKIRELGGTFTYTIHDLRATFGMNLTDALQELVAAGKLPPGEARKIVQHRMWHSKPETTDQYLGFRNRSFNIGRSQARYETEIEGLIEKMLGSAV